MHKFFVLFFLALSLGVAACGKMADPTPVAGSGYPHTYPKR